jgi:hypothetical protein
MKERIKGLVSNRKVIIGIYILFALASSIPALKGTKTYVEGGAEYKRYNNYTIFEKSFEHLTNNQDLYVLYPEEHWDLYKYTPTFSVFFGIFHAMPDWLGVNLWNLLNAFVLLFAVYYLPRLTDYQKGLVLLIVLLELTTSMQNHQSNALIAGLIILSFGLLERNKLFWAPLPIVFSVFIKLFGIVGFALFLFYPEKLKAALYTLFWGLVLFFLPLFFIDTTQYFALFKSFLNMLKNDHDASYGISVMGWLNTWFSLEVKKNLVVGIGALVFLLPFYKLSSYKDFMFKYLVLCSVLIWIVIFNHKAESPTFILAMAGVALWFILSEKNALNISLFIGAFVLTSLSPTDLFPRSLRESVINPYVLKAFPIILIWVKIIYDMLTLKSQTNDMKGSTTNS